MYQHKNDGITFSSDGNKIPFMMSDASNKGDPVDSKRAYGFCTIWMGGPVIASAKKLDHSSSATAANEYMAISNATKYGIWLRQLLTEMDLKELVVDPTIVFADNNSANQWCQDDKVTQGNMWIAELSLCQRNDRSK